MANVKCDNCDSNAEYTCADPGVNPVNYCSNCLPAWLRDRANLGHFPLVEAIDDKPADKAAKKKAEPKADEVAADESN